MPNPVLAWVRLELTSRRISESASEIAISQTYAPPDAAAIISPRSEEIGISVDWARNPIMILDYQSGKEVVEVRHFTLSKCSFWHVWNRVPDAPVENYSFLIHRSSTTLS